MRKNGFTLIELLAVIVILAIIALIATPIILGIINDAREKANERSVELYASAIKNGIAAYQLRELKEVAPGTYTKDTLPFDVEYDGKVECSTIELYEDGGVYVADCTVNDNVVEYTYGTKQEKIVYLDDVCNSVSVQIEGTYTAGDKYTCIVDSNKSAYTFYILTTPAAGATSVNLIMDSNINISGEAVKEDVTDLGLVAWYADSENNTYGPITAMNHLQTATKDWTNTNPQIVNSFETCEFDENDNIICEDKSMTNYKVNARMPYYSEVSDYSEDANNAYLYDNLSVDCYDDEGNPTSCDEATEKYGIFEEGMENKIGVEGYWTFTSFAFDSSLAWYVDYMGNVHNEYGNVNGNDYFGDFGVRPVINLSI